MSATPTCPHCGHAMTTDEMVEYRAIDLTYLVAKAKFHPRSTL